MLLPVAGGGFFFLLEDIYREPNGLRLQFAFSAPTLTGSTHILGTA